MSAAAVAQPARRLLDGPFATPPDRDALAPTPATARLVRTQVKSLLAATPSYHQMGESAQAEIEDRLIHIAAYAAECLRDIYWQSEKVGQTPVLKEKRTTLAPLAAEGTDPEPRLAHAQANDFKPRAADQIGRITQQTLRAIAFPTFVADLIRGTFDAIMRTSVQQMESFSKLLTNVSKTVDQFMADNVSDGQAHEWLAQSYPRHLTLRDGKAVPRDGAEELPSPDFERELHVSGSLDESSIEETLLPAARRKLAESRLQMLSTLVLMGINRIVITSGKIRATMGFHIDTSDSAFERTASDTDFRFGVRGHASMGFWGVEASTSLAYVSSTRAGSDAEINVETDLTGEVELHFKSDYFPVERFANASTLKTISSNTAVPAANPPPTVAAQAAAGGEVPRYRSPQTQRKPRQAAPELPPMRGVGAAPPRPEAPIERGSLDPKANRPAPEQKPAADASDGQEKTATKPEEPVAESEALAQGWNTLLPPNRTQPRGIPWIVH